MRDDQRDQRVRQHLRYRRVSGPIVPDVRDGRLRILPRPRVPERQPDGRRFPAADQMQFLQVRAVRHGAERGRHVHTRAERPQRQDLFLLVGVVLRARRRIRADVVLQVRQYRTDRHENDRHAAVQRVQQIRHPKQNARANVPDQVSSERRSILPFVLHSIQNNTI